MDDDDDGNSNGRGEGLILTKTTMNTPTVMTPLSVTTPDFDITTNLWPDAFLAGRGAISTTMTTAKITTKTMT